MTPSDYDALRRLLRQQSGLDLSPEQHHLVARHLTSHARREGFADLDDLLRRIKAGDPLAIAGVTEAMTTTETSFFRDRTPFAHLREMILPAMVRARAMRRRLRIWSAGCASGQEPYSIAMCLKDFGAALDGWQIEIVATDLSRAALKRSEGGLFSQSDVQHGLPIHMLLKHFTRCGETSAGPVWRINSDLRAMVTHRSFNLLHDCVALGTFDVIFCRNVLVSFDQATRARVLAGLSDALQADGYLVLGEAETVRRLNDSFVPYPDRRDVYRRDLRLPSSASRAAPFRIVA